MTSMAPRGLKKLISGWLGKAERVRDAPVREAELQSNFEQTVIRLQQMVEERAFVDVRFPGRNDASYQSLILRVDPIERYVLIDELFPAHGAYFVAPGDEVEITSVRRGIPVRFVTWIRSISIDETDGIPAYRLALPDSVEAKQRRTHYRLAIDAESGVRLRIRGENNERVLCSVMNLSQTGVSFTCQGNLSERLRALNVMKDCSLSIPGMPDIKCDLEARSFEFRKAPTRHTMVGARFENPSPLAVKQLEQYIFQSQREQRRESRRS